MTNMTSARHSGTDRTTLRRAIAGSLVGTSLEWYDFFLYGSAAALVFGEVFFPSFDPVTGTLLSFLTFAVAFVARPVGGIIAGHYGDRIGRKKVLIVTVVVMGISTVAIGLLPTYNQVGIWSPILLLVVRLVQGLALGGEWAGGALMIAERSPAAHRGFFTSFVQVGVPIGTLLSTGVLFVMSATLSAEAFSSWGWRVPFILSFVAVIIGVWIRRSIDESPAFVALEEHDATETRRSPVIAAIRSQPVDILRVIGIRAGADIVYYTLITFMLTYVTQFLGVPRGVALLASLLGAGLQILLFPLAGALSDRFGRRRTTIFGALGALVWMLVAFFPLLDTKNTALIVVAVVGGLFFHAGMYGVQAPWICELFDASHRYSGASIGTQVAGIAGGALAPFIALSLLEHFDSTVPVVAYVVFGLALVLVTALLTRETAGVNTEDWTPNGGAR